MLDGRVSLRELKESWKLESGLRLKVEVEVEVEVKMSCMAHPKCTSRPDLPYSCIATIQIRQDAFYWCG